MNKTLSLPRAVRDFVHDYIHSVAEVEALLLMRGDADSPWSATRLAGRLYVDARTAEQLLTALHGRGLLAQAGAGFHYDPCHIGVRAGIDALAECYPRFLIEIAQLIHTKPHSDSARRASAPPPTPGRDRSRR